MRAALALVACAVGLSGCTTAQTGAILTDLQGCERHYNGAVGGGGLSAPTFTGTVQIDCPNAKAALPSK